MHRLVVTVDTVESCRQSRKFDFYSAIVFSVKENERYVIREPQKWVWRMWDPRWVGRLWWYHAGVFQHQLPILCGHQLGVLQVSWILTWTAGKLAPTWQVKASVPHQMPVTSRGSPGYPHFCVTWLQIGGVRDPLLGCDGFLWNAEMIRLITVEHQAPWNIHSIRLCALRLFAGLTFSLSYSVLHTVLMIISSSVRFQTHFSVLMPQQFCEAGSSYRSYFTV